MKQVRIIVEIKGGVCQAVYSSDSNVNVDVIDYDNILSGDMKVDELAENADLIKEAASLIEIY